MAFVSAFECAAFGQVRVNIDRDGVHANGAIVRLTTEIGSRGSDHKIFTIVNRSGRGIRYRVHTHEELVRFHDEHGTGDLMEQFYGELNTTDDAQDEFPFYAIKRTGRPGVFQERIGVEAWDADTGRELGYTEVPVIATFSPTQSLAGAADRPDGFEMLGENNGRLFRCPAEHLPLRVYSNGDDIGGIGKSAAETARRATERAIKVFNLAARDLKSPSFFQLVSTRQDADVVIDWSGDGLPTDALGYAIHEPDAGELVIVGVAMRTPDRSRHESFVAEDLAQELGHILGLGHSLDARDLMGPHPQHVDSKGAPHSLDSIDMTNRDRQALAWLYRQQDYVPIVPRRAR